MRVNSVSMYHLVFQHLSILLARRFLRGKREDTVKCELWCW
ncbi:hypothetical protein NC651_031605 [Populus alba x Populus x berolinensis]|nr:hypothetical protein NC651_031605 [Populus alba x Populus x berolinensis]